MTMEVEDEMTVPPQYEWMQDPSQYQFSICFTSHSILKDTMKMIESIMGTVTFMVCANGTSKNMSTCSLRMESMNRSETCACKMRLACVGMVDPEGVKFSIDMPQLVLILKSDVFKDQHIRLSQKRGDHRLTISTAETGGCEYVLNLVDLDPVDLPFHDLESQWTLSFNLNMLKSYLRTEDNLKTKEIRLAIYRNDAGVVSVSLEGQGTISGSRWMLPATPSDHDVYELDQGTIPTDPGEVLFNHAYSLEHIKKFTLSMNGNPQSVVLLRLCSISGMEPHILVVEYDLGQEDSNIMFVSSARVEEST
jgi:hypothetical protein